ncbi:hypothetical protein ACN42_g132 [Penicillium freii]|uniref:NmrA-like domain-containing protein n=1 Tax=Penicillium freii TaxID=48697 RepID=A0A117NSY7_PENFR|nr:hypothetical protein ACN42_g132 [Penicillium freii]
MHRILGRATWLSLSTLSKPGVSKKIQADLTGPGSVAAAVNESRAKRAFIHLAFGSSDHTKTTLEALKSAGIDFVVFLSSYTVLGEARDVEPSDIIPYIHAQVEINLDEIFGPELRRRASW